MELRQYIRMVYRMAMEGRTVENSGGEDSEVKMKELVQKWVATLCPYLNPLVVKASEFYGHHKEMCLKHNYNS